MDLLEIEIKSYCDNIDDVILKLEALGAEFISSENESDLYFSHPCRDYKKTDEALRVRKTETRNFITYKGPKIGKVSKSRLETEVEVDDYEGTLTILDHLGFKVVDKVEKERTKYKFEQIEICVDNVLGVGDFVELEKKDYHREKVEKELFILAEKIGLKKFERRSYLELKIGQNQSAV